MAKKKLSHFFSSTEATLNHPFFYQRIFAIICHQQRQKYKKSLDPFSFLEEEYETLSRKLDHSQIQESCAVRNVLKAKQLATILIDDQGKVLPQQVLMAIDKLTKHLYSLGPDRQYDAKRQQHLLAVLKHIASNKEIVRLLNQISYPHHNRLASELIRQTLNLPASIPLTDAHATRVVLSAWLCLLRQNVGSCFATAPATIIQTEQPEHFLKDLNDLLIFCRLSRIVRGEEYFVPLSHTWGNGDLKKPLLLKKEQKISPKIWQSPGLIAAFEAAHLFEKETSKSKSSILKNWLMPLLEQKKESGYFVLTTEEIIRFVLLQKLQLSESQLKRESVHAKERLPAHLIMMPPSALKEPKSIHAKCARFYQLFEQAKNAFKLLTDHPLLKAWEFTLASFSETKLQFASWNLYASLGMNTDEPGGIGAQIYSLVKEKIDQIKRETEEIQLEYEAAFSKVKIAESRLQHASEEEAKWLRSDFQNRLSEFRFLEEQKTSLQKKAEALVHLYEHLYEFYQALFKDYFQEVYDAEMQEVQANPFDDSPAGFRLLYKHGRSQPSQWSYLKSLEEYIEALIAFFIATESQIASSIDPQLNKEFAEIVSAIVIHLRTKEFQESAFHRMAIAHRTPLIKDPLNHLEKVEKKPWAYTSGGTMNTLISCYYELEQFPTTEEKWIESEMELLVFIVDTLKLMPTPSLNPYLKKERFSLLMHSPTHAFLLKPNYFPFEETWQNQEFTYTSVRDKFVKPAELFVRQMLLNQEMVVHFINILSQEIPPDFLPRYREVFRHLQGPLTPLTLREAILENFSNDRGLQVRGRSILPITIVDHLLFTHLPFFSSDQLPQRVANLLEQLTLTKKEKSSALRWLEKIPLRALSFTISAAELQNICKSLLCLAKRKSLSSNDYHLEISLAARALGYALPMPLIFADTNWVKEEFGFVVNPGTATLELWRLDYTASAGYPMPSWKEWLDGSHPSRTWGIYNQPFQYGQW